MFWDFFRRRKKTKKAEELMKCLKGVDFGTVKLEDTDGGVKNYESACKKLSDGITEYQQKFNKITKEDNPQDTKKNSQARPLLNAVISAAKNPVNPVNPVDGKWGIIAHGKTLCAALQACADSAISRWSVLSDSGIKDIFTHLNTSLTTVVNAYNKVWEKEQEREVVRKRCAQEIQSSIKEGTNEIATYKKEIPGVIQWMNEMIKKFDELHSAAKNALSDGQEIWNRFSETFIDNEISKRDLTPNDLTWWNTLKTDTDLNSNPGSVYVDLPWPVEWIEKGNVLHLKKSCKIYLDGFSGNFFNSYKHPIKGPQDWRERTKKELDDLSKIDPVLDEILESYKKSVQDDYTYMQKFIAYTRPVSAWLAFADTEHKDGKDYARLVNIWSYCVDKEKNGKPQPMNNLENWSRKYEATIGIMNGLFGLLKRRGEADSAT